MNITIKCTSTSFSLLALALSACSPTPSIQDAASNRRDASAHDNATVADVTARDNMLTRDHDSPIDSTVNDAAPADHDSLDVAQNDTTIHDAEQPDTTVSDSALPDSTPEDVFVFYGPFSASNLPRPITDADNNGANLTMVAISVPASLNANFVDLHVEIQHQDSRDLLVEVLPPTGNGATLYNGSNCSQNCDSSLVLEQREPVYNDTQGEWVLRVTDKNTGSTGTIGAFTVGFAH